MRGALAHRDVIEALRPFIVVAVTARHEDDMPREVGELSRGARNRTSNIHCFVLDAKARPAGSFPAFRGSVVDHERMARGICDELGRIRVELPKPPEPAMHLPDIKSGVRVYLSLRGPSSAGPRPPGDAGKASEGNQYAAPVVECVPIGERERKALAKPERARDVDAAELRAWLEQLTPPAIMEGMGGVKEISGALTLEPSGLLRGDVKLVLDDPNRSSCRGRLEGVVTWKDGAFATVRAAFEGVFGKPDRMRRGTMDFTMKGAIESRPE